MARLPLLAVSLWCAVASAATVSGRIADAGGAGISGGEVRLWARAAKGFSFTATGGAVIAAGANGVFSFTGVPAGDYLVDVRPGNGYGDRWYDTNGNGYVAADADVITLTATQTRTGVDITVEQGGGVDGVARLGASLAAGLQVRVEQVSDPRVHHNEDSKGAEHQGELHMRGLPPGQYRVIVHDQNAAFGDQVSLAPFAVAPAASYAAGTLALAAAPADPLEPNDSRATATMFTATRAAPYNSPSNTRIAPRNLGDVDWYCTTALEGERFIAHVLGLVNVEGGMSHESPWVDPVVAELRADDAGTYVKVAEDDDTGPLSTDALLDTGEISAGPVCFAVSTYGDTAYTGMSQGSAGDYQLTVRYGNRGPAVTATGGGSPLPATLTIDEGDLLSVDLTWSDPENDVISATWSLIGASGASASMGSFNTTLPGGSFLWRAPQTAAEDSPYVLTFRIGDGDLTRVITMTVVVRAVNVAPTVPLLLSPIDGGHVMSQTPALVCRESTDEDEETLSYDFEVYYGGDGGTAAQGGTVTGLDGGWLPDAGGAPATVAFTPLMIPENSHVRWRARAYDGHPANGYSPWSAFGIFIVDVMNDPPAAPVLDKPADGDTVLVRRPTLAAAPPLDPEGDAYSLYFEIAKDSMFTISVGVSPPVAVGPGATTMWTFDKDLEWGAQYFARAWALDVRNGKSLYSNVNAFAVRDNMPPTVPPFTSPDSSVCSMGFVSLKPDRVQVGPAVDPEMDEIRIQVRVFLASEDPVTATPAFDQTKLQTTGYTEFDVSALEIPKDLAHRFQARAVDNYGASGWSDCVFTVGERPVVNDGGQGGGAGGGGDGTGGGGTGTKGGCHCGSIEGLALVAMLALVRRRRQRPG